MSSFIQLTLSAVVLLYVLVILSMLNSANDESMCKLKLINLYELFELKPVTVVSFPPSNLGQETAKEPFG